MGTNSRQPALAGSPRQQRAQAARLLSNFAQRSALDWDDLLNVPQWAALSGAELQHLAWCVGVWFFADELQHSIDGRLLSDIHSRLGDVAFTALISTPASADGRSTAQRLLHQMPSSNLDAMFCVTGREGLLSSIDSDGLRRGLAEVLWPGEPEVTASARRQWLGRAVVEQAWTHAFAVQRMDQGALA